MNIETLSWDPTLCRYFDIPMQMLPEIRSSAEIYGKIAIGPLKGITISGVSCFFFKKIVFLIKIKKSKYQYIYIRYNILYIFRF